MPANGPAPGKMPVLTMRGKARGPASPDGGSALASRGPGPGPIGTPAALRIVPGPVGHLVGSGLGDVACWYNDKHEALHAFKGTAFLSVEWKRSGERVNFSASGCAAW